jgi:hypothetical protein
MSRILLQAFSGGLLMSGRRSDCDSGEPNLWSNGSVFIEPSASISIDPSPHIPLQQTTVTAGCGDIDPCTPCICERLSTPSDEGYARITLRGSTTLKTAVGLMSLAIGGFGRLIT